MSVCCVGTTDGMLYCFLLCCIDADALCCVVWLLRVRGLPCRVMVRFVCAALCCVVLCCVVLRLVRSVVLELLCCAVLCRARCGMMRAASCLVVCCVVLCCVESELEMRCDVV